MILENNTRSKLWVLPYLAQKQKMNFQSENKSLEYQRVQKFPAQGRMGLANICEGISRQDTLPPYFCSWLKRDGVGFNSTFPESSNRNNESLNLQTWAWRTLLLIPLSPCMQSRLDSERCRHPNQKAISTLVKGPSPQWATQSPFLSGRDMRDLCATFRCNARRCLS